MRFCLPMILTAVSLAADQPKADLDMIQGTWDVSRTEVNGKPIRALFPIRVTFDGDKLLATVGKRPPEPKGTFKLDPGQNPKAYDVRTPEGLEVPGIYVLEGDTLKVCLGTPGGDRPASFTTDPDDGRTLIVYRRQRPAEGR